VIGVMLAGTALGNFTGGLLADRVNRPDSGLDPRYYLSGSLMSAGGGIVFVLVALAFITPNGFWEWGVIRQILAWTFVLFFLPMFMLGMISPQVIRLAVPDVAHVGQVAGRVYAWSTTGAIVGTFLTGYLLLSSLGTKMTVLSLALLVTLTSVLVHQFWKDATSASDNDTAPPRAGSSNVLLYIFSIVLGGVVGGFILQYRFKEPDLVEQVESNYYTIKVSEILVQRRGDAAPRRYLTLTLDHLVHSTVDPDNPLFLGYEHEEVQLEFLRGARSRTPTPHVLVIGGGGYTFPRAAKELMPETELDVVEIDPKVTEVAYRTLGLKKEYGLNDINMDGRQFVSERAKTQSYDLVIQDAVNDFSVPAHLLTKEYNDDIKRTLKGDGVYLLTIIDSVQYGKLWRAAMRTLRQTFSHVTLMYHRDPADEDREWERSRHVYVIYASDRPFNQDEMKHAVSQQRETWIRAGAAVGDGSKLTTIPGGGWGGLPAATATDFAVSGESVQLRTFEIQAERLAPFLAEDPGVLLTDQYAPVDNLMAEVFRYRNRSR
jgi:spermidine synthase